MPSVGDLVANLTMNTAGFSAGGKKAIAETQTIAKTLEGEILGVGTKVAGNLAAVFAPLAIADVGFGFIKSSVTAAKESQLAFNTLEQVIANQGTAATLTASQIADYAAELQRVTNFEDDATVAAAAFLASFHQIRGDNLKLAIAVAQDMAQVMGTDLDSAVRKLGKSIKELSADEVGDKLKELDARFHGAAKAAADQWVIFKHNIDDVQETFGGPLLQDINKVLFVLNQFPAAIDAIKPPAWLTSLGGHRTVALGALGLLFGGSTAGATGGGIGAMLDMLPSPPTPIMFPHGGEDIDKALDSKKEHEDTGAINEFRRQQEEFEREERKKFEEQQRREKEDADFLHKIDMDDARRAIEEEKRREDEAARRRKILGQDVGGPSGGAIAGSREAASIIAQAANRRKDETTVAVEKVEQKQDRTNTILEDIARDIGNWAGLQLAEIGL